MRFPVLFILVAAACSRQVVTTVAPAPAPVTDANIAAIVLAADSADVSYAQLASARSTDTAVTSFAATMVRDHGAVSKAAIDLATKLQLAPVDNEASLDMRDHAAAVRDTLRELTGAAFDKAYANNEVTYHEQLLAAIDGTLLPSAKNQELHDLLVSVRPAVVAHLAHARMLQAAMTR